MKQTALKFGLFAIALTSGCSMPPPSNAEILRTSMPPLPVTVTSQLFAGAQASFGETSAIVESAATSAGSVDLTARSVGAALSLVAASASDIESVRRNVRDASRNAEAHVRDPHRGSGPQTDGTPAERAHRQADAVASGSSKISAGDVATMGVELAGFIGAILSGPEEPLLLNIGADSHGVPYRATCTTKSNETLVQDARRSISCVIARADVVPTSTWHLNVVTSKSDAIAQMVPTSRGSLQREPVAPGDVLITFARPDPTTPRMRWSYSSLASFAISKGNVAIAGLEVDNGAEPPKAWLARVAEDDEERQAVEVSMAVLALVPWPSPANDDDQK